MTSSRRTFVLAVCALHGICSAADLRLDLTRVDHAGAWAFLEGTGRVQDGQLILDGRQTRALALYEPHAWQDVKLQARFKVEPAAQGVLACGFIVRARDAETFYAVHFDRAQAILIRSTTEQPWNEIGRKSGLEKPAGAWHEGAVECVGDTIQVYLNGQLLYKASDANLRSGRIGFYAGQGLVQVKDIVVSGQAARPDGELLKPVRKFMYVCQDGGAGGYEAFPDVCRLADGRLMCAFYAGYGHVSLPNDKYPKGGRLVFCTSGDEGRTWGGPQTLYDGPADDRDPSVARLADGRILCTFFSLHGRKQEGGYECPGTMLTVSQDAGATWSEPRLIAPDYYCSSPVRALRSGRLILGLYAQRGPEAWGAVTWSDDHGKTWVRPVDMPKADRPMAAETDLIELEDGTLYAVLRCDSGEAGWSVSHDRGASWEPPQTLRARLHCPYLHRAPDGSILLASRVPLTMLRVSRDECRTWSEAVQVDAFIGAYPSMVTLRDGSILIVYYEEGATTDIRARRFSIESGAVKWLPADGGGPGTPSSSSAGTSLPAGPAGAAAS